MNEEWRAVYEHYEVSSLGRVRSLRRVARGRTWPERILAPFRDGDGGYLAVEFAGKRHKLHRLVATAFHGDGGKLQVNHKNGDPSDNRAINLEWCTASENVRHAFAVLGRKSCGGHRGKTGAKHHASKAVVATHIDTGETRHYGSGAEAAREIGLATGVVPRVCSGAYRSAKGWFFAYEERSGKVVMK
jgi:hypothetical protein